jgi:4-hydroxybenzoate polyprenyltransferase
MGERWVPGNARRAMLGVQACAIVLLLFGLSGVGMALTGMVVNEYFRMNTDYFERQQAVRTVDWIQVSSWISLLGARGFALILGFVLIHTYRGIGRSIARRLRIE